MFSPKEYMDFCLPEDFVNRFQTALDGEAEVEVGDNTNCSSDVLDMFGADERLVMAEKRLAGAGDEEGGDGNKETCTAPSNS